MTLRAALRAFVGDVARGSDALRPRAAQAEALLDAMTQGWADRPPDGPRYVSYLSRDGTPFEPSVRISKRPSELRFVLEVQPEDASREGRAYLDAALAVAARLEAGGWLDLAHARRLEDLFRARPSPTTAALWLGASLDPSGAAGLKAYFVVTDPAQWPQAFARFGLADLARELASSLPAGARAEFVSVDLATADPRLKLYVRHPDADPGALDRAHARCPGHRAGDAAALLHALFGGVPAVRRLGPISTYHVSIARRALTHASLNVPLEPLHYASPVPSDDDEVAARAARFVEALGLRMDPLYPHMLAVARRDGVRYTHHRYAGFQRRGDDVEVTVYVSTLLQARRHGLAYGPATLGPASLAGAPNGVGGSVDEGQESDYRRAVDRHEGSDPMKNDKRESPDESSSERTAKGATPGRKRPSRVVEPKVVVRSGVRAGARRGFVASLW